MAATTASSATIPAPVEPANTYANQHQQCQAAQAQSTNRTTSPTPDHGQSCRRRCSNKLLPSIARDIHMQVPAHLYPPASHKQTTSTGYPVAFAKSQATARGKSIESGSATAIP